MELQELKRDLFKEAAAKQALITSEVSQQCQEEEFIKVVSDHAVEDYVVFWKSEVNLQENW